MRAIFCAHIFFEWREGVTKLLGRTRPPRDQPRVGFGCNLCRTRASFARLIAGLSVTMFRQFNGEGREAVAYPDDAHPPDGFTSGLDSLIPDDPGSTLPGPASGADEPATSPPGEGDFDPAASDDDRRRPRRSARRGGRGRSRGGAAGC